MVEVDIELSAVHDWDSFYEAFAVPLGFPDGYGRNMNAWIDCLSDISSASNVGMTRLQVPEGEDLTLRLADSVAFYERCPEQYLALLRATAAVNLRKSRIPGARRLLLHLV